MRIRANVFGDLFVELEGGYKYRRINGAWQMLSLDENWTIFAPGRSFLKILQAVADYENCLRSYGPDEGPEYSRKNKKGHVGEFFKNLQKQELYAATKNIFAPVQLKYDASAENRKRFNREYSYARLTRRGNYEAQLT